MTSLGNIVLPPVIRGLKNLTAILQKGVSHAQANSIKEEDYIKGRIYPDMGDLAFQIYSATNSAKGMASRINPDLEPLTMEDVETTFPALLDRIQRTIAYLEKIDPASLAGREQHEVVLTPPRITVRFPAIEYVLCLEHPNFWFHVATAYDILRMKGVPVGKKDYWNGAGLSKVEVE